MGVNSTTGTHGQPIYNAQPRTTADFQAGVDYAAKVGNRVIVDSHGDLIDFLTTFGFNPWDGLESFNTDSGETLIWSAAQSDWLDPDPISIETTGVFTESTGWSISGGSQKMIRLGQHDVSYYFSFKRTAGNLPAGNFENVAVGRVLLAPTGGSQPLGPGYSGAAQFMVDTTGLVLLTSSNDAINTNDYISAAGRLIV